jgi:putative transposase
MKSYYIEINPTDEQKRIINQTIGTCRYIYNEMIATNQLLYEMKQIGYSDVGFISANDFSKYVNHQLSVQRPWIKDVSSKAIKQSMYNCEKAFKKFFKKQGGFPKFKKKNDQDVKMYLPKNSKTDFIIKRHKIKIPILKWVRLKEYGYILEDVEITSCTLSIKANKYYISILTKEIPHYNQPQEYTEEIGVDLGIKELVITSDGEYFKNINKTKKVKKLEKRLKRQQRRLSKKINKNKRKGGATKKNIKKSVLSVQKTFYRLSRIRTEYVRFVINSMVRIKPEYIAIEDLNVRGMMKNRHLSKAIQNQMFGYFKIFLIQQCVKYGIKVRVVDRFFPSSKTCSQCGNVNKDLKLKDRTYYCDCGLKMDRDLNASINIRDCKKYKIAC